MALFVSTTGPVEGSVELKKERWTFWVNNRRVQEQDSDLVSDENRDLARPVSETTTRTAYPISDNKSWGTCDGAGEQHGMARIKPILLESGCVWLL